MDVTSDQNYLTLDKPRKYAKKLVSVEFNIDNLAAQEYFTLDNLNPSLREFNHISVSAIVKNVTSGSGELSLEGSPDGVNYEPYDDTEFLDSVNTVTVDGSKTLHRFSIEIFTDETIRLLLDKSTGTLTGGTIQIILIAKRNNG